MNLDYIFMGNQIRHYRRAKGMSQTALAAALGISAAHVGHIERGTRHASLETVVAISQQLDVSLDLLVFSNKVSNTSSFTGFDQLRTLIANAYELIDGMALSAGD